MASIATCPLCAKQLAVPESASSNDHAECPLCEATFLLANVVQLAVPPARIICMNTETESSTEDSADIEAAETTTAVPEIENAAAEIESMPSWEARLKRAIETDANEMSAEAKVVGAVELGSETEEAPPIVPRQVEQPEFDFQLETPPQAETYGPESVYGESSDSAAEASAPIAPSKLFEADLGTPGNSHENITHVASESSAVDDHAALSASLQINSKRRSPRRSWVKITALMASTSVVGILFGLYALLWLQGPRADYLGLANYLPQAMLPTSSSPDALPGNESLATSDSQPPAPPLSEEPATNTEAASTQLAEAAPLAEMPEVTTLAPSESLRQDEAVQPATAELPVATLPVTAPVSVNISAEQFGQLAAAAEAALPRFIDTDLSSQQSIAQKGKAYMTLSQLAEQFDFTRQLGLAPAAQADSEKTRALFEQLFGNTEAQGDLSKIATQWWGHDRRSNQGILLAGVVQDAQPAGNRTLCQVAPGGQSASQPIPVLIEGPAVAVGSRVGIIGRIVGQEDQKLAALGTNLPQVVLSLQSYDLP